MTFVAPTGYGSSGLGHSPRSGNPATFGSSIAAMDMNKDNAIAGPSGSGHGSGSGPRALNYADQDTRRLSQEDSPVSPSSAPPNPSMISVTHPPEFIHTHHPRRGSLTPLGLNVISPIPPIQMSYGPGSTPHSPVRSVGFIPQAGHAQTYHDSFPSGRRGSAASSSSTLTLSRPAQLNVNHNRDRRRSSLAPAYPAGFNPERRRSSLTPAIAHISPPSPTRAHASGVFGNPNNNDTNQRSRRPGTSDGQRNSSGLHTRHHTSNGVRTLQQQQETDMRRGSMPQLHYGGWTPRWNPSLPPQRGSVGDEPNLPDEEFKFGSVSDKTPTPTSTATFALKAIEISPSRRASKAKMDVFQEQEAAEAERQQRAFLAATYGADGRRARERLSIGGPVAHQPSSPTNRRPSLMLWEKLGMAAAAKQFEPELAASSAPTLVLPSPLSENEFGPRRGSLPITIPSPGLGRTSSSRGRELFDREPLTEEGQSYSSDEKYEALDGYDLGYLAPIRPAPPLLPLSDPGPRLLPSTLALQRASHLLNSRNLQADPLPHPLPPSLHPPVPVDVTEFDIDFILAGSRAQLGGKTTANASIDAIAPFAMPASGTTLKLGGEEEDSFAKFVGKFDDEYGGRRGEWTFRAKPSSTITSEADGPRSVWDSPGAGPYDVYANGEVRCKETGSIWKTNRKGICEYELEYISGMHLSDLVCKIKSTSNHLVLAPKAVHGEAGGTKIPSALAPANDNRQSLEPPRPFANRLRVSISEATRAMRSDSTDSSATAKISSSLPTGPAPPISTPKKSSRKEEEFERSRNKLETSSSQSHHQHRLARMRSRETEEKDGDKKKTGFFKRGIIAPFKNSLANYEEKRAAKEERDRERQQAHSWSGVSTNVGWIHPSGKNTPPPLPSPTSTSGNTNPHSGAGRTASSNTTATSSSVQTSASTSTDDPSRGVFGLPSGVNSRRGSGSLDHGWRQGKAWAEVPEDAVAMVLDCSAHNAEASTPGLTSISDHRQALLVWYVPFNSEADDRDRERATTSNLNQQKSSLSTVTDSVPPPSPTSSLPKFQKLLRRRASKDKEVLSRNSSQRSTEVDPGATPKAPRHPLPFRAFRIVARIVDSDDLRSETDSDPTPTSIDTSHQKQNSVPSPRPPALSVDSAMALKPRLVTNQTNTTTTSTNTSSSMSASTAPTSTMFAGRTISTVIAVCHSRSQGVEFVLEGLDRLGYCVGESAWGPTGYEEWRGTGLSESGRELLDLLWAGCTAVMGLA